MAGCAVASGGSAWISSSSTSVPVTPTPSRGMRQSCSAPVHPVNRPLKIGRTCSAQSTTRWSPARADGSCAPTGRRPPVDSDALNPKPRGIDGRLARRAEKSAQRLARKAEHPGLGVGKRAGLLAGVAGLGAVGTVAGVSAARSLAHRSAVEDLYEREDFGLLDADRGCVVTTPDGIPLVVREVGPTTAPLTVVFAHGFCLQMGSFHFQRAALADRWGDQVRMVFYDQRGHGQSS